jgi:hypothetical protein
MRSRLLIAVAIAHAALGALSVARAATITWKGHTWQVTSGGMAGVCQGDLQNVTVDGNGYLHLRISNGGGTWTASELFTTDRLGFGTYQWQVDGPIDTYDKNVVLGMFPYGPAAGIGGDGTNEIDIEYSRWGQATGPNGDWTDYPASGMTKGELSYTFSLGGATLSTSRFAWSSASIASALFGGLQAVDSTAGLIKSWTYAPANPTVNIPQQALPLGINLWCFDSPPSDGKPVEIVIRDFTFVSPGGAGGVAGGGGGGGKGGGGKSGAAGKGDGGGGGSSGRGGGAAGAGGSSGIAGGSGNSGAVGGHGGASQTGGSAGNIGGAAGAPGGRNGGAGQGAGGTQSGAGGTNGTTGTSGAIGSSGGMSDGCNCALNDDVDTGWPAQSARLLLAGAVIGLARRRRSSRS